MRDTHNGKSARNKEAKAPPALKGVQTLDSGGNSPTPPKPPKPREPGE